jgi:hypothetical protein
MSKFDITKPVVRLDFVQPGTDIVLELAKQIAEDMIPICRETCDSNPEEIIERLLSEETMEPILVKLQNDQGSYVKFKPPPSIFTNPIIYAHVKALSFMLKRATTTSFVKFLKHKDNKPFRDELIHACERKCNVNDLANNISELLEPHRDDIVELFELRKSAGGRKQKSRRGHKHRGHKQKSRRGHKTRRHKRRSTRKH